MNTRLQRATRHRFESLESRALLAADPGWALAFSGPVFETETEVHIGPDGFLYAAGGFSGTADFDPGPGVVQLTAQTGANDMFVAKYTPQGSLVWAQRFGGDQNEYAGKFAFDPSGDLLLTGHSASTTLQLGATTLTPLGSFDAFVTKIDDSTGNVVWAHCVGGAGQDTAYDVAVNNAGESYVVGTFRGTVDFDPGAGELLLSASGGASDANAFVWKLDASGNTVWARAFGDQFLDNGHRIALDGAGAVYASGTFRGDLDFGQVGDPLVITSANNDFADVFLVKLDEATGDGVWARQATGPSQISHSRIAADGAGGVYLAGVFQDTVNFGAGTPTLVSAGGSDAFVSRWDADGNLGWTGALAGAGETIIKGLAADAAGNALLTLGFDGTVDLDPGVGTSLLTSSGGLDGAALKLNSDGSLAWARQISGPGVTLAQGIFEDAAGNVHVGGFFQGSVTLPTGHTWTAAANGVFLMKLAFGDPATKFYVVDDAAANQTFEYGAVGASNGASGLNSGNAAPRGAASTAAGDRVWVIDANRKVFVYDINGNLLGSWTAGSMALNATPEGIATNGTDVWIVDSKSDKVFKYTGAASRTSGSQNASSSFNLNSGNRDAKDIVTDGASLWVVNDSTTDKVFKYSVAGSLQGSWTITGAGSRPTGITIDPTNVSGVWIVDSGTDRVYEFTAAAGRTSGSQAAAASFALAAGNTNPQGIADPPPSGATQSRLVSSPALPVTRPDVTSQVAVNGLASIMRVADKAPLGSSASVLARQRVFESFAAPVAHPLAWEANRYLANDDESGLSRPRTFTEDDDRYALDTALETAFTSGLFRSFADV